MVALRESFNEELSRVPTWVKFHDFSLVAYTSDGLSLIATIIGTPMMLDSYTNSMCLKSLGRSSYARILIKIDVSNGFSDNLVMAVPNLEGPGYTKETIRVEYEWEPPRCSSKGGSSEADDDGFIKVKKNKSSGNFEGTKNFKPVSVKPKTIYRPKVNQPTKEASPKTDPSANKKKVSTTCNSSKKTSKTNASTSGVRDSEGEVEPVDNELASFMASKPSGVGGGTNSLMEQWRKTYENADYDYDPYVDDMYEGLEIPHNIQSIYDNLDIKVRGRKKK
ncbi:RNA-directed DNA polymerase, eukaryota, reverse transcriptase zinc-binding domain protein [Tanacetum coccineum]|uniref:RNA-directed DNA polymerase, eukaryota, reverse transcriptase zinc-binding domain protein n=1 Tax=Tanacetum coccineum TaxID=301880 RepID=A0ABQ5E6H6_9ASTR